MKHITFYFDVISPYAYLAFEKLPHALMGISYSVTYKPVVFGAILKHFGQLGPAEISPKRTWTYRQVAWLAKEQGTQLHMPTSHPFNPISLLRLAIACGERGQCHRFVAQTLFDFVWKDGLEAADPQRLATLVASLKPRRSLDDVQVKSELKANTDAAIEQGIFGVPMMEVDQQLFWGGDAMPLLRAYLQEDVWFECPAWTHASQTEVGTTRRR